jgi:hypothetical protein
MSPTRIPRSLIASTLLATLPILMGAEGGCNLLQETLKSPVQAVTTILERADGTVEVDLTIVSTEGKGSQFVTSAHDAELRVPGGATVPLEMEEPGHYRASSDDYPELEYLGDAGNYRVTFELDDRAVAGDAAGDDFIAVVEAPSDEVTFEFSKLPEFAGDTAAIDWTPRDLEGLLEVRDENGELLYTTFDWSKPEFDGSKWASLIHNGHENLPVDVFANPGSYTVSFCAVQSQEGLDEELSSGLGILSGFLAGRCVEDVIVDVPE